MCVETVAWCILRDVLSAVKHDSSKLCAAYFALSIDTVLLAVFLSCLKHLLSLSSDPMGAGVSQSRCVSPADPSSHGPLMLSDDTPQSDLAEFSVSKSGQSPFWQNFNKLTSLKNGKK